MEGDGQKESQLLFYPSSTSFPVESPSCSLKLNHSDHTSLNLNLSMSIGPLQPTSNEEARSYMTCLQVIKQQTADQIRGAAVEKAYAERIRELTRRELELAEKEFAQAKLIWEQSREDVEKVERMKELSTKRINSTCLEITCQTCMQRFRP